MQSSIAFSLAVRSMILQGEVVSKLKVLLFRKGVAGVDQGVKIVLGELCELSVTLLDEGLKARVFLLED